MVYADSTVYKGRKKKSIQYYAIKSVDKDQKQRVLQEVGQALGQLCHQQGCACTLAILTPAFCWLGTGAHHACSGPQEHPEVLCLVGMQA